MTNYGVIHLISMLYLMLALSVAISFYENGQPRRILRETGRRWLKFAGVALALAVAVNLLDGL